MSTLLKLSAMEFSPPTLLYAISIQKEILIILDDRLEVSEILYPSLLKCQEFYTPP